MKKNIYKLLNDKGVTAIIVALLMVVFLGIAALAVDVGYNKMVRNQLQNAADAAALAAAGELGSLYTKMIVSDQLGTLSANNQALVINSARVAALANQASRENVTINDNDIIIGTWDTTTTPASRCEVNNFVAPNAVRITVRRDESVAAGPITTFFARIWGTNTMNVTAQATAALSGQCTGGKSPFTISHSWFEPNNCPTDYLTWDGIGGGTAIDSSGANVTFSNCIAWRGNKQEVQPVMECIAGTATEPCPDSHVGGEIPYTNGTVDNLFDKGTLGGLLGLFDLMKSDEDNNSLTPPTWTTEVEISDFTCGLGSGNSAKVWGYATIVISELMIPDPNHPSKNTRAIKFTTDCQVVQEGRGGGCKGPNIASIPSLVQ
ncbi:MAG: hypothetical protein STSR0002_06340 [Smithella sp.]